MGEVAPVETPYHKRSAALASSTKIWLPLLLAALAAAVIYWALGFPREEGGARGSIPQTSRLEVPEAARTAPTDPHFAPSAARIAKGGTIRGRVQLYFAGGDAVDKTATVPPGMKVLLRPARFLKGRATAEERDLPVATDRGFSAEGLSFGAYDVCAAAPGWSGTISSVELAPLEPYVDITLRAVPCPDLVGFLRDVTRAPIEGCPILLTGRTERGSPYGERTKTEADGSFRIPQLEDGHYQVVAGVDTMPLHTPLQIDVRRGKLPEVTIEVPTLARLEVTAVVKGLEFLVEGMAVSLSRTEQLDQSQAATTDAQGKARFDFLLPGEYVLRGSREYFRVVNAKFDLVAGQFERLELRTLPEMPEFIPMLPPVPQVPVPPENR